MSLRRSTSPFKKRLLLSVSALTLFLLLGVFLYFWIRPGEPRYEGKPLSYWANEYCQSRLYYTTDAEGLLASNAIYSIGSAAVPYALKKLRTEQPNLRSRSYPMLLRDFFFRIIQRTDETIFQGVFIFEALGARGVSAIPQLQSLLSTPKYSFNAALAAGAMGAPGINLLQSARTNSNQSARRAAVEGLQMILLQSDLQLQSAALKTMLQTNGDLDPAFALEATEGALLSPHIDLTGLARREPSIKQMLTNILNRVDLISRQQAASNALQKIHQSITNPVVPTREN